MPPGAFSQKGQRFFRETTKNTEKCLKTSADGQANPPHPTELGGRVIAPKDFLPGTHVHNYLILKGLCQKLCKIALEFPLPNGKGSPLAWMFSLTIRSLDNTR